MTFWNGTNWLDGMEGFEEFTGYVGSRWQIKVNGTRLKCNYAWNWPGKLPKPGMELGGICGVEKRQGFYCAVLRLVE